MFTKDDRLKTLKNAHPTAAELYCSLDTGELLGNLMDKHGIQDDELINIVGDIILGLYPKHELISLLTSQLKLSFKVAGDIAAELGDLLDTIPEKREASPQAAERPLPQPPLHEEPAATPPPSPAPRPSLGSYTTPPSAPRTPGTPLTREELMKALEAKRTMRSDIEVMKQKLEAAAEPKVGYGDVPER